MTFGNLMLVRYTSNTAYNFGGVATIMNYEDVVYDPYGIVTIGAAWKFTANHDGYYLAKASILWANFDWQPGWTVYQDIFKNNGLFSRLDRWQTNLNAAARYLHQHGHDMVWLEKGDFIDFRYLQTSGAARATHNNPVFNYCAIYRM